MLLKELLSNPSYPKKSIIEKLVMHKMNITKEQLFTHDSQVLPDEDVSWLASSYGAITQDHRPIEYVMGYCEFSGHRFGVTEATLIPRPETEYMIEAVRERIKCTANNEQGTIHEGNITLLDIGTGCGVLGLSTVLHCGSALKSAVFTDLSSDALDVAKGNYKKFLDAGRIGENTPPVVFIECSLMDHEVIREVFKKQKSPLAPLGERGESSDTSSTRPPSLPKKGLGDDLLIVANLPYIPDGLFEDNTDPSVHKREPKMAFVGGDDGMDLYRIMLEQIVDLRAKSEGLLATSYSQLTGRGTITLFLEMMTWQVEILRKEFGEWFEFEEVKTFHFNIRIVKATVR